jgi:hypothetical protein
MSSRATAKRHRAAGPTIVHRRDSVDITVHTGFGWDAISLGLFSGLISARLLWPSEDANEGTGLYWCLWVIVAALGFCAVRIKRDDFQFRFHLADAAVCLLVLVVMLSTGRALDHRPATNLCWEWAAIGLTYLLYRQLPRNADESTGLIWSQIVMVTALACYGIFQTTVEFSEVRNAYNANPERTLMSLGIDPNSSSRKAFEDRLLGSNEPMSTFALANSLAGVLVGPLVILFGLLFDQLLKPNQSLGTKLARIIPLFILQSLIGLCLLWTKSRSAWLGLIAGIGVTSLFLLRKTRLKYVVKIIVPFGFIAIALFLAGLASGRMDLLVLTESVKSLRYRVEYWVATWDVIRQGSNWLWGIGPANFAYRYMQFKLPEASEEISDPHNVFLELWVTAGIFALIFFGAASAFFLWTVSKSKSEEEESAQTDYETTAASRNIWKLAGVSVSAFLIAPVLGGWNLFQEDLLRRWLVLSLSWLFAWFISGSIIKHCSIKSEHLGAAFVSILITWLAAGGIGFPSVALGFWLLMAIGLNLADDRWLIAPTKVVFDNKALRFLPVAACVAVFGGFIGATVPFWKAESANAIATELLMGPAPKISAARQQLLLAIEADPKDSDAYVKLAELEYQNWLSEGSKPEAFESAWKKIEFAYQSALSLPRNPIAVSIWRRQAGFIAMMIRQSGDRIPPVQQIALTAQRAKCLRTASTLYPTSAPIFAELAEVDSGLGLIDPAKIEARKALELSDITPHADKKLDPVIQRKLKTILSQ